MDHPSNTLLTIVTLSVLTPFVLGDGVVPRQVLRPYCSHTCGNVSIPYPFGIEDGCYLVDDKYDYKFVCNDTYTPPKLILGINLEVLKVSLEGELTINNNVSFDCYNNSTQGQLPGNRFWNWVNLVRFTVSRTKNVFIAIGCDTYVWFSGFRNGRPYETGCMTQCSSLDDVVDGACNGIGCCETTLPGGVSNMTIRVRSFSNHSLVPFNPCSSAFAVERETFEFYKRNLTQDINYYRNNQIKMPIIFNWTVGRNSCSVAKADGSYICMENTECHDTENKVGYRCKCKDGYSGNPYLSQGCTGNILIYIHC
ncbi:wall-associated receptor kinase 2-like [Beta vulgaris subsp. vulgaris]|uniref:wall-associated receptor kinase 2-like n=1 Tax=Beta vulgaris subsp. vulgaris TaxID=3555 RepID=UPI002036D792|nr:wall-associated receptor kinase 2-like [Beta vulgaris subsp. vulgaris]